MSYATAADLARLSTGGWEDLARRVAQDARVSGALLRALAEGGNTDGWAEDSVALAQDALAVLNDHIERVSRHADTYIAPRYRGVLPLPPHLVAGSDLPSVVAAIVLRRLLGVSVSKDAADNTRWADEYLRDLRDGKVSLGGGDTVVAQPPGRLKGRTSAKTIDWGSY